jgi:hypothetical protein
MFIISGTVLWNLGKEGKEKRKVEHQQYCKTTSVKVKYIRICIESCQKRWGSGREGVRESNGSG